MILVEKWLNGSRNYKAGVILYNQFGTNQELKKLLALGEQTPGAKEQLLQAMQELVAPVPRVVQESEVSFSKMPAGDDPVCKAIQEDWKQHYTAMNMLRGKLAAYGEDNSPEAIDECNVICQKILEHERYITACWEKLRYYQAHHKLPEDTAEEKFEIPGDPLALAKLIETLKRNIRRNKQKASAEPANALYPALVKRYENQLKQIQDAQN